MNKPILFFKQGTQYITSATALGITGGTRLTLTSTPSQALTTGMYVTGTGIATGAVISSTSSTITATGTGTSGTDTITISGETGYIVAGMTVSGTNIASGVTVVSVVGSTVTLSSNNTGTVSGTITFGPSTPGQIIALDIACTSNVNGTITFQTPSPASQQSQTGPWIVYDRIGDRDIITQSMIAQLYLQPVNVPAVIRGKFSEVGQRYKFLPYVAEGDLINMYYYKAWPLLFAPIADILISTTGTVGTIAGAGTTGNPWTATITNMTTTDGISVGNEVIATAGTGSFGTSGTVTVASIVSSTSITVSKVGGTIFTAGTVTDIKLTNLDTQTNPVLQTWPEGYVYSTLREYYIKRHNETDAATYEAKFRAAWSEVEDQNNLGKWSGGHTRLTSVWQPRQYRQYNIK
jgi:hypothetical protein